MATKHIVVVGGGPAGMIAAGQAAQNSYGQAEVLLLEKNKRLGKKLAITGKGRCNVTNDTDVQGLVNNMPGNGKFLYSAFSTFNSSDLQEFLEDYGVPLKVERGQRVFPQSDNSFHIIDALRRFLEDNKIKVTYNAAVSSLVVKNNAIDGVIANGNKMPADAVILCAGGASYPTTGSNGDGYRLAQDVGHTIVKPRPALVPLETKETWATDLQGLSLRNVNVKLIKDDQEIASEFGEMLFTHYGITGPIVLTLSRLVSQFIDQHHLQVEINLKPALSEQQLDDRIQRDFEKNIRSHFKNSLGGLLPSKLIPIIVKLSGIPPHKPVHQITREERQSLVETLTRLTLTITRTRPFTEAIVTSGGVATDEVVPATMESKLVSGLFLAGELIDIDGYTGGFNLQAAFSTGFVAGQNAGWFVSS